MSASLIAVESTPRGSDFAGLSRQIRAAGLLERRRWNYGARIVLTLGAYGVGWWVDEHNRHHSHPNHEGCDPDIGESVITSTDAQAVARAGPVERFIASRQAWLFFPLLTLEGLNLHVQSIDWLRSTPIRKYRRTVLLAVHAAAYLSVLLLVLSPAKALAFLAIQQAVWGVYMGCSFAPNHKGMPTVAPGQTLDYLRRQVVTTRNVRGGVLTDFVLGGLNYQVEHHLFPNMPRANLRKAQPIVRAYCADLQVPYSELSLLGSYVTTLRHLHAVGASRPSDGTLAVPGRRLAAGRGVPMLWPSRAGRIPTCPAHRCPGSRREP